AVHRQPRLQCRTARCREARHRARFRGFRGGGPGGADGGGAPAGNNDNVNSVEKPMQPENRHAHWQDVYTRRNDDETSWYQPAPATSLRLLTQALPVKAAIIDIGGGTSRLVDHLLAAGYADITVLDIAESALARARERLGERAHR